MSDIIERAEAALADLAIEDRDDDTPRWVAAHDEHLGYHVVNWDGSVVAIASGDGTAERAAFIAAARQLVPELLAELKTARVHAGPGPYEPSDADGSKAPTWQELRDLADHNFRLYAKASAELKAERAELKRLSDIEEWRGLI